MAQDASLEETRQSIRNPLNPRHRVAPAISNQIVLAGYFSRRRTGSSAHVTDLPGCVAAGATLEETRQLIPEAIEFHFEGMRQHGEMFSRHPISISIKGINSLLTCT